MNKKFLIFLLIGLSLTASVAFAQTQPGDPGFIGPSQATGASSTTSGGSNAFLIRLPLVGGAYKTANQDTVFSVVAVGVNLFLGLLGVIFLILIIYAGFQYMMAQGDDKKISAAKDMIWSAIIGIIIVIGAYAIWNLIFPTIV